MFLRIARVVPGTGIVFAVLVVVAFLLESDSPSKHASNTAWMNYYADSGNRHKEELALILIGIGGLCFLQFLGSEYRGISSGDDGAVIGEKHRGMFLHGVASGRAKSIAPRPGVGRDRNASEEH